MSLAMQSARMPARVVSIWIFVGLVIALPAAAVALARGGSARELLALAAFVLTGATLALLERQVPYDRDWNRARGDIGVDTVHVAVATVLGALVPALVTAVLVRAGADAAGVGLWPWRWPLAGQVLLALACADLGKYALHRASHESSGLLWRIHAVHHDTPRLYWLNATRFHPLNVMFNVALAMLPIRLLGVPAEVVFAASLVSSIHNFISHANVDFRLGALNWVFSGPELHRWHHAQRVSDANHNYGGTLLLWDVLFGTRFLPARRLAGDAVGLEGGVRLGTTYTAHLLHPFRRAQRRCARPRGPLCAAWCR